MVQKYTIVSFLKFDHVAQTSSRRVYPQVALQTRATARTTDGISGIGASRSGFAQRCEPRNRPSLLNYTHIHSKTHRDIVSGPVSRGIVAASRAYFRARPSLVRPPPPPRALLPPPRPPGRNQTHRAAERGMPSLEQAKKGKVRPAPRHPRPAPLSCSIGCRVARGEHASAAYRLYMTGDTSLTQQHHRTVCSLHTGTACHWHCHVPAHPAHNLRRGESFTGRTREPCPQACHSKPAGVFYARRSKAAG